MASSCSDVPAIVLSIKESISMDMQLNEGSNRARGEARGVALTTGSKRWPSFSIAEMGLGG